MSIRDQDETSASASHGEWRNQEQIAAARGPVETPAFDDTRPSGPGWGSVLREKLEEVNGGPLEDQAKPPTSITLIGDDRDTFAAFADVCARVEANQRAGADLMREYQAALQKVSAMSARHACR